MVRSLTLFSRGAYSLACKDFNRCHANSTVLIGAPVHGFSERRSDRGKTNLRGNWQVRARRKKFLAGRDLQKSRGRFLF